MYYVIAIIYPDSTRTDQFHIDENEIVQFIQFLTKHVDFESYTVIKRTYKT
jgi:ribosomal protein L25 (general stress protein Ctc)